MPGCSDTDKKVTFSCYLPPQRAWGPLGLHQKQNDNLQKLYSRPQIYYIYWYIYKQNVFSCYYHYVSFLWLGICNSLLTSALCLENKHFIATFHTGWWDFFFQDVSWCLREADMAIKSDMVITKGPVVAIWLIRTIICFGVLMLGIKVSDCNFCLPFLFRALGSVKPRPALHHHPVQLSPMCRGPELPQKWKLQSNAVKETWLGQNHPLCLQKIGDHPIHYF